MPEETSEPAASVAVSETVETNRHVNVAEITAKRTSGGTEIKVKSAVLEEYFKNEHAEVCRQAGYDDPGRRHTSSTVVPNLKAYRGKEIVSDTEFSFYIAQKKTNDIYRELYIFLKIQV